MPSPTIRPSRRMFSAPISRHCGNPVPWIQRDWVRPPEQTDRSIAAHEAGHVTAIIALGYRTFAATIRPNGKTQGLTQIVRNDRLWARPRDRAIIFIAGPLAQKMRIGTAIEAAAGPADDPGSDWVAFRVAIRQSARRYGGSDIIEEALGRLLRKKAEKLLIQNLHQLVALETALFERIELDESEIADVLRNAR